GPRYRYIEVVKMSSGTKTDPPKHQNKIGWKPNAGVKINETVSKRMPNIRTR
ncbi:hypothetical protein L195_g054328, partial [Trifolium pratense]